MFKTLKNYFKILKTKNVHLKCKHRSNRVVTFFPQGKDYKIVQVVDKMLVNV